MRVMETLLIHSQSKNNVRRLSALAHKLGDRVFEHIGKTDKTEAHFASESALAKDWLTVEEDKAWRDL